MLPSIPIPVLLRHSIADYRQITEFDKNSDKTLRNLTKGSCLKNKGDRTSVI